MSIDKDTTAAAAFWKAVRDYSESAQPWDSNAVFYETKPDEKRDFTLVSQRVYHNRKEFLAVMAAAGIDSVDMELTQKKIVLPSAALLLQIKRETGFESDSDLREDYAPLWKEQD